MSARILFVFLLTNWRHLKGTICDLVTGEEKRFGNSDGSAANHVAITVEMAPVDRKCKYYFSKKLTRKECLIEFFLC